MSAIQELYQQAVLAEAAYANFWDNNLNALITNPEDVKNALIASKFSPAQATAFVKKWRVAHHIPDTTNGFSATLFERLDANGNSTGQYSLGIRGSTWDDFGLDFQSDVGDIFLDGVVLQQLVDLYNYWQRLTAPLNNNYQTARLVTLVNETVQLQEGLITEAELRSRPDIIIDSPSQTVRTVQFATSSQADGLGLTTAATVDISGHSLGGHLAMAFSRLFPSATGSAVGVNGLGFLPTNSNVNNLFAMLGGAANFDASKILNVYGERGFEVAAQDAYLRQVGGYQGIEIESAGPSSALGHVAAPMTDSLAVYNLFAMLDPALNAAGSAGIKTITDIIKASSGTTNRSLESTVDTLRTLFQEHYAFGTLGPNATPTPTGNRESFYTNAIALETYIKNLPFYNATTQSLGFTLQSLTRRDAASLVANAQTDIAHRYALYQLNPYVIGNAGTLYSAINNTNGALDLYNPTTHTGSLTTEYLKDRAAFLINKINANTNDRVTASDDALVLRNGTFQYFDDRASGYQLYLVEDPTVPSTVPTSSMTNIVFGSAGSDTITGSTQWDKLYGGEGNDTLTGGGGNDYLEGGQGTDTYHFSNAHGLDQLLDTDAAGTLYYDGTALNGGTAITPGSNTYRSDDDNFTYTILKTQGQPDTLLIQTPGGQITVKNYQPGHLNIVLRDDTRPTATPTHTLHGDLALQDFDSRIDAPIYLGSGSTERDGVYNQLVTQPGNPNPVYHYYRILNSDPAPGEDRRFYPDGSNGIRYEYDPYTADPSVNYRGNEIRDSATPAPGRIDTLWGGVENDHILGYAGRDTLRGRAGHDILEGGEHRDELHGDDGDDILYGDTETDLATFLANTTNDNAVNTDGDFILGGSGNDITTPS